MKRVLLALALFAGVAAAAEPEPKKEPAEYVKVEAKGKLRTGIMAIGGETTGVVLSAGGVSLEVELPPKTAAEKLNGKVVIVTGTLYTKRGVTRPGVRTILKATKVAEVK